jgi:hypothetical protein
MKGLHDDRNFAIFDSNVCRDFIGRCDNDAILDD